MVRLTESLTLIKQIGAGGMAEVFEGCIRRPGGFEKRVAIKRMLPWIANDPKLLERFMNEARLTAALSHPNIAQTLDVLMVDGQPILVLEFIDGFTLKQLQDSFQKSGRPVPLRAVLPIAQKIAAALAYAHSQNILHRDVSPHNIMITSTGHVKLLDFGVAKIIDESRETTITDEVSGKVPYLSPEALTRSPLGPQSDLFSLGTVLFELTTGRRLFKGLSVSETIHNILNSSIPDPRTLRKDCSEEFARLILRALERETTRRVSSATTFLKDLTAVPEAKSPMSDPELGDLVVESTTNKDTPTRTSKTVTDVLAVATNRQLSKATKWAFSAMIGTILVIGAASLWTSMSGTPPSRDTASLPAIASPICRKGKPCGNSCIAKYRVCHQPAGTAKSASQ